MQVLVIGNGGREHAILQALKKSKRVEKLYCMKGNAGTAEIAENVNVDYMDAARGLLFSADGTRVRNLSSIPVYAEIDGERKIL